jgi:hypothetical protein
MSYEMCERCHTIKAFICHNCGARLHPYYSGTLSGGGIAPWWHDDDDSIRCEGGSIHGPTSREPMESMKT